VSRQVSYRLNHQVSRRANHQLNHRAMCRHQVSCRVSHQVSALGFPSAAGPTKAIGQFRGGFGRPWLADLWG
jgi:hypothetical protein